MKNWILILAPMILMISVPEVRAHNVVSVSGYTQHHQHVYRRQQYGKPLQEGHLVQSPGSSPVITWGSVTGYEYGKSIVPRNGPVIDDLGLRPYSIPKAKSKYGATVNGYGKAVNGYGKPGRTR